MGLLLIGLTGCSKPLVEALIPFSLSLKGDPIDASDPFQIHQFQFFVSNLTVTRKGQNYEAQLLKNDFQIQNTALLSLVMEDDKLQNRSIEVVLPFELQLGDVLAFDMGVPFAINHENPLTQPPPLNRPDMFWSWQLGHKFLRVDMTSQYDSWAFHLGSLGCKSPSRVRAPKERCAEPNVTKHSVTITDNLQGAVHFNFAELIKGVTLTRENRCVMHGENEPMCAALINNMQSEELFYWQ